MTFRSDLINRAGLFRHYAAWHEDENNWSSENHIKFSYYLGACVYALERIHTLREECIDQFKEIQDGLKWERPKILYRTPGMFDITSSYSTFLLNLRLAQNSLLSILGQKLKIQTPQSMNKFTREINKQRIDKTYREIINSYWLESGNQLKNYRDLDQHYGLVIRVFWIIKKENLLELVTYLPDGPNSHSQAKFTYTQEKNAFNFAAKAFEDFHTLANSISLMLDYKQDRSFDYNQILPSGEVQSVSIKFDPFQEKLCVYEAIFSGEQSEYRVHEKETDLEKYKFIKINKFFSIKENFFRYHYTSSEHELFAKH